MSLPTEQLLHKAAEGTASDDELAALRVALDGFAWPPGVDLGAAVRDAAGEVDVASAVLAEVGAAWVPVGRAVRSEAGAVDVAAAVMDAIGARSLPVAEAVRAEAGRVEVAAAVAAEVGHAVADVGEAVRAEAGRIDVAGEVMAALGATGLPVAEAVRAAAGEVAVGPAVMRALGTADAMPPAVAAPPAWPAPANRARRWVVALVAVAAAVAVVLFGVNGGVTPSAPTGADVAVVEAHDADRELQFASASEVQIEDLSFGDDVVVFQDEGDDGALILWVDDEEV